MTQILTARSVLPVSSEPIENGAVVVDGTIIAEVGPIDDARDKFPDAKVVDFGEAAIVPGFVNCHSHLELTAMRGSCDAVENDFAAWLLTLTKLRGEVLDQDEIALGALAGAAEGARAGVTCFGDIGRFGMAGMKALRAVGLRGIVFQETDFSPEAGSASADFDRLRCKFEELSAVSSGLVYAGISPHAPYTVSRSLFEKIARFALDGTIPLTVHAAESKEEDELLRKGTGFFRSVYEKFSVNWSSPLCSPIEFLRQTGLLEARPLLAHCVWVTDEDISVIASAQSRVAHCPKSNAKFGHGYAPFEKLLDSGVRVGLGTDSVASNNICDMLDEARNASFAARNRSGRQRFISARDCLAVLTLGGADALGLADRIGTLELGKQADLAVISLDHISQKPVTDVEAALVFSSGARDVIYTMVAGRVVYSDGRLQTVDETEIDEKLRVIGERLKDFMR